MNNKQGKPIEKNLEQEIEELRLQLEEARELINAIRTGEVDALAVQGSEGPQIFTLKSADHTYRVLVEEMNEGAITLNKEGIIIYSNIRFANFLNLPLEKVIGSSFYSFVSVDYYPMVERLLEKGWQGSSIGEIMIQEKNGAFLPFSLSIKPLQHQNSEVLGIIITDLSAQKEILAVKSQVEKQNIIISNKDAELRKEKETKEEAQRFRIVLEGIPQMAWTSTPDGRINYTNQFWHQYTELSFEDTKDYGWHTVIDPEDKERTLKHFNQYIQTGEEINIESRLKRASDGSYRWHLIKALPIKNIFDQIILWVGTCTDIHDQKEAIGKLADAKEQLNSFNLSLSNKNSELQKINNDLDNFIYTASHDLKAPVSNIEGLVNTLLDELGPENKSNKGVQHVIDLINISIAKFKATILDLTEITKIQKGTEENNAVDQNISEIIDDVRLSISDIILKSQAVFYINTSRCPTIKFSKKNLNSILYNLISNAIKYCAFDRNPEITITTKKLNGHSMLIIQDNGLGMNLTKDTKIFSMFKRLHDHVEGTGVGLYLVKRILDNAGGKIEVESQVGKGSIFKVYFKN